MDETCKFPSVVLITGASSGIGYALAMSYATPGRVLFLAGRDEARLSDISLACRQQGSEVHTKIIDVSDKHIMDEWITQIDQLHPLDLVIANAGISGGGGEDGEPDELVYTLFDINLHGVLNTVLPVSRIMKKRGHGQIALMSSMAGFRGFPSAPAYSSSKAAVKAFGEGLRGNLAPHGIKVSVICPGFVKSRITDKNKFPMPFLMSANKAANIIKRGLQKNKPLIAFP